MAITFTNMADKVLLWVHGRRLGIVGDALGGATTALSLDGTPIGSTRGALLIAKATGVTTSGSISLSGTPAASAAVGDAVVAVMDFNTGGSLTDVTADFEATISVAGAIQQTAGSLNNHPVLVFIQPQS